MNKKFVIITIIGLVLFFVVGFIRLWTHESIFGTERINLYELLGNCWQGDVRTCDYDPFE